MLYGWESKSRRRENKRKNGEKGRKKREKERNKGEGKVWSTLRLTPFKEWGVIVSVDAKDWEAKRVTKWNTLNNIIKPESILIEGINTKNTNSYITNNMQKKESEGKREEWKNDGKREMKKWWNEGERRKS